MKVDPESTWLPVLFLPAAKSLSQKQSQPENLQQPLESTVAYCSYAAFCFQISFGGIPNSANVLFL
jgi:hypothetical protein